MPSHDLCRHHIRDQHGEKLWWVQLRGQTQEEKTPTKTSLDFAHLHWQHPRKTYGILKMLYRGRKSVIWDWADLTDGGALATDPASNVLP